MPRELCRSLWGLPGGSSLPCRVRLGGCRVTGWGLAQVGEVKVGSWSRPSMWCVGGMGWAWGPDLSSPPRLCPAPLGLQGATALPLPSLNSEASLIRTLRLACVCWTWVLAPMGGPVWGPVGSHLWGGITPLGWLSSHSLCVILKYDGLLHLAELRTYRAHQSEVTPPTCSFW